MAKVTVEALKDHTYNGKSYKVGDTYDFEANEHPSGISVDDQVQSLQTTGFAMRVDRVAQARKADKAAAKSPASQKKTAVGPMTTEKGGRALAKPRATKK